jgi:hypothetical protein
VVAAVGIASLGSFVLGCQSSSPSSSTPAPAPLPSGFTAVSAAGYQLGVPAELGPRPFPKSDDTSQLVWLVFRKAPQRAGEPYVYFAKHAKPAQYTSRVFGLTALEAIRRDQDKTILSERQHQFGGIEVTDVVVDGVGKRRTREWRRLFVNRGEAFVLAFGVDPAEAPAWEKRALGVLDSVALASP